jgi:prophage antirepressor-like protein
MKIVKPNIERFNFLDNANIRAFTDNGEYWFCAADVCAALGYEDTGKAVKQHCRAKGVAKRRTPTDGGNQMMTYMNEGNLYRLVARSRLPSAERFEEWVFDEVLPALRKTGEYKAEWIRNRHQAASSFKVMTDVKRIAAEIIGREVAGYEYANEARLVNLALSGEWGPLNREELDTAELDLLAKLENMNSVLIARAVEFKVRKEMLKHFAIEHRAKLQLAAA